MEIRIGSGFDIHRLEEGLPLYVGGIHIPFEKGSLGHSDGDVLVHALCDAMLGALNEGDLGQYFPSTDQNIKGISSIKILDSILEMISDREARIINIDATIIAEDPSLSPYFNKISKNLSSHLKLEQNRISVKAKSSDGIADIGKGNAIACMCNLLLEFKI